ncbi:hypothetical protein J6590_010035 [Homalodisca vitripennis]|nr:hypothetical protein J6590_010035 [Homalodisca vitripennis]
MKVILKPRRKTNTGSDVCGRLMPIMAAVKRQSADTIAIPAQLGGNHQPLSAGLLMSVLLPHTGNH